MNIRNVRTAVRNYQHENELSVGDPISISKLIDAGFLDHKPKCPDDYVYEWVTEQGETCIRCANAAHRPEK